MDILSVSIFIAEKTNKIETYNLNLYHFFLLDPNEPVITSSVSLGTSIIGITWQSPPQDIVSSYKVHYTGRNVDTLRKEMALPASDFSYNVTGLRPGETYSMSVTALTVGPVESRMAESDSILETTGKKSEGCCPTNLKKNNKKTKTKNNNKQTIKSMCISNYMLTTFFYLGRFQRKLAEDQCS